MASEKSATTQTGRIKHLIYEIRGQKVMSANRTDSSCGELEADLANVYGVTTGQLKQQVKRNRERFPSDFVFQLTNAGYTRLMLQIAASKTGRGGRCKLSYVFTEHGAIMASMCSAASGRFK
jgi:hypothetical protein